MKRIRVIFAAMLIFTASVCCAIALTACAGKHEHNFGEWQVVQPATCEADGLEERLCADCKEIEQNVLPKLGHALTEWQVRAATCDNDGLKTRTCTRCDYEEKETISKLSHVFGEWQHYTTDHHIRYCVNAGCNVVEIEECDYKTETIAPTCTQNGYTQKICKTCGESEIDENSFTAALGHELSAPVFTGETSDPNGVHTHVYRCTRCDFESEPEECVSQNFVTDPTCTEEGGTGFTCLYCNHTHYIDKKAALGHDFSGEYEHVAGTHTHKRVCNREGCNEEQTANCVLTEVADKSSSCIEGVKKLCETCGYAESASGTQVTIDHNWSHWTHEDKEGKNVHTRSCNKCGKREEDPCAFTPKTTQAKCTEDGYTEYICEKCSFNDASQKVTLPQTGHVYGNWQKIEGRAFHKGECLACHIPYEEGCAGVLTEYKATCERNAYDEMICSVCGGATIEEEDGTVLGHAYSLTPVDGGFDENGVHRHCFVCANDPNHKQYENCTKENGVVTEPNCRRTGYTTYVCDECHTSYKTDAVPARNEHNWSPWVKAGRNTHKHECQDCHLVYEKFCSMKTEYTTPTCEEDGGQRTYCTICDRETIITEAKLGHNYGEAVWTGNGDTHKRVCLRPECGKEVEEACELVTATEKATCTTDENISTTCKYCNNSRNEKGAQVATGHSYPEVWQLDSTGARHFRVCTVCLNREEGDCNYTITKLEADCENPERERKVCDTCKNEIITDTGLPAYGHIWTQKVMEEETHTLQCERENCKYHAAPVEEAHDYSRSNLCSLCGHDGLVYELDPSGVYAIVVHAQRVRNARWIIIPEEHDGHPVKEIGSSTGALNGKFKGFYGMPYLERVELPESLEKIGEYAFACCPALTAVTVRNESENAYEPSLKEIGDGAFDSCTSLISAANLPETLEVIGRVAFRNCSSLKEIEVPDGVKFIGDGAFERTAFIKSGDHWNGNVLYIGKHLIVANENIGESYTIENGTLTVGANAFSVCTALKEIIIPVGVEQFNEDAFGGLTLDKVRFLGTFAQWMAITFDNDNANPVHVLGEDGSFHIDGATSDIVIPETVTNIPSGTFRGTDIVSITIPESVTYIGAYAFADCQNLAQIIISGDKLTHIGKDAFKGTAFYNNPVNWTDGVLYLVSGENGVLPTSTLTAKYLIEVKDEKESVEIDEATVVIADEAFAGSAVSQVTVPNSVIYIGDRAFANCRNLTSVTLGTGLKELGAYAFANSARLNSVVFTLSSQWWAHSATSGISRLFTVGPDKNVAGSFKGHDGSWRFFKTEE